MESTVQYRIARYQARHFSIANGRMKSYNHYSNTNVGINNPDLTVLTLLEVPVSQCQNKNRVLEK
jgi:hypothetical protein